MCFVFLDVETFFLVLHDLVIEDFWDICIALIHDRLIILHHIFSLIVFSSNYFSLSLDSVIDWTGTITLMMSTKMLGGLPLEIVYERSVHLGHVMVV